MFMFQLIKDWDSYAKAASTYADKFVKDDYNQLNSIAWSFYENISDRSLLAKAAEWAKRSVELKEEYAYCDTYAAVLFKLGKNPEAQAMAEKAIQLAKQENQDYRSTQELLDKINAMK